MHFFIFCLKAYSYLFYVCFIFRKPGRYSIQTKEPRFDRFQVCFKPASLVITLNEKGKDGVWYRTFGIKSSVECTDYSFRLTVYSGFFLYLFNSRFFERTANVTPPGRHHFMSLCSFTSRILSSEKTAALTSIYRCLVTRSVRKKISHFYLTDPPDK